MEYFCYFYACINCYGRVLFILIYSSIEYEVIMSEYIYGRCCFCHEVVKLREFTLGENIGGLLSYGAKFFFKGTADKISDVASIATGGSFSNYICTNCDKKVMQCGKCSAIIPYQDTHARCPHCGYE